MWEYQKKEAEANALLISEAKNMFYALKECKKELEACYKRIGWGVENKTGVMKNLESILNRIK